MAMKSMQLRTKLLLLMGVLMLALSFTGAFNIFTLTTHSQGIDHIQHERVTREKIFSQGLIILSDIRVKVVENAFLAMHGSSASIHELDALATSFYIILHDLKTNSSIPDKEMLEVSKAFRAYYIFGKRFLERNDDTPRSMDSLQHFEAMQQKLTHRINTLYDAIENEIDADLNQQFSELRLLYSFSIGGFIAISALIIVVFWSVLRSIARPLKHVDLAIADLKSGAQGIRLPVHSDDEIGRLGRTFNDMAASLEEKEAQLQQTEKELHIFYERTFDGIGRTTLDGRFLYLSPGAGKLLGYESGDEAIAELGTVQNAYAFPKDRADVLEKILSSEGPVEVELQFKKRNGDTGWLRARAQTNRNVQGVAVAIDTFFSDVTSEHIAKQLKIEKEAADAANKAKTDFLSTISHEIRTPLNSILGLTDVLLVKSPSPEQTRILDVITKAGEQLLSVVNDVLDLSKIESSGVSLETISFDLRQRLHDIHENAALQCKQKGLRYSFLPSDITQDIRLGDPMKLQQVLTNIISNAIKFTPSGHIEFSYKQTRSSQGGADIIFCVKDTGIGIPDAHQANIFTPFVQADSSTVREYGGTGLGLAITYRIVQAMQGSIWFKSEENVGSQFYIQIPLPPSNEVPEHDKNHLPTFCENAMDQLQGRKVLVAEDVLPNQDMINIYLNLAGMEGDFVQNGIEAVDAFKRNKYDLLLLDISMPEMNGVEATRAIREHEKQSGLEPIPIIIQTAHSLDEFKRDSFTAGADDFLCKPFDYKTLLAVIAKNLRSGEFSRNGEATSPPRAPFSADDLTVDTANALDAIIPRFLEYTLEQLRIGQELGEDELSQMYDLAHSIKGAAALYGFSWLKQKSEELQQAAQDDEYRDGQQILAQMAQYIHTYQEQDGAQ